MTRAADIHIIPFSPRYHDLFRQLNLEWLDKYGLTEDHDLQVLNDPQGTILDRGGFLWLAERDGEIVGTAGLMKVTADTYELAKMSVAPAWQGYGISKRLLDTCLAKAREIQARKLILFSNSQLTAALGLYSKYGFKRVPVTGAPFQTADVKMELDL